MFLLFFFLFLACIVGLIRPFSKLARKHFVWGAAAAFVLMLVTAPPAPASKTTASTDTPSQAVLSPAQAEALEKKNAPAIAKLNKQAATARSVDEKLRIYTQLAQLAPANSDYSTKQNEYQAKVDARARYSDHPEEALSIGNWHWTKSGFGSVMIIDRMTIRNDAPFAIKDFTLKCVHQGPSGTEMDSNTRRVYDIVPADGSKTVRDMNMGFINSQVVTSSCEITDAVAA
jgi:hypothetical protein